jgi:hypothetical protein
MIFEVGLRESIIEVFFFFFFLKKIKINKGSFGTENCVDVTKRIKIIYNYLFEVHKI